jgi:ubiquinone/menaquinone biosynthesis C-methylase UbiE
VRIAPKCDQYLGVDFSPAVLARVNEQLQMIGELKGRVLVGERRADDFTGFDDNSVDTVLLSSVIQYFPTISYLTHVLNEAIRMVSSGGQIYVGDIRSLPLLPAFASSVELFQATPEMRVRDLRDRIRRRLQRELELVVSPAYFRMLQRQNPRISTVEIRPLRGHAQNEMTRYRYQAILHVGGPADVQSEIEFIDWTTRKWTLDDIRLILRDHPDHKLGIKQIQNARSDKDIEMMHLLDAADPMETVEELRCELARQRGDGICPQELFDLEAEGLGFRVFLSWLSCRNDGSYDAAFIPNAAVGEDFSGICWPQPDTSKFVYLGNGAIQSKHRNALKTVLTEYCVQHIADKASQVEVEVVDTLPSRDGDADLQALLAARNEAFGS